MSYYGWKTAAAVSRVVWAPVTLPFAFIKGALGVDERRRDEARLRALYQRDPAAARRVLEARYREERAVEERRQAQAAERKARYEAMTPEQQRASDRVDTIVGWVLATPVLLFVGYVIWWNLFVRYA